MAVMHAPSSKVRCMYVTYIIILQSQAMHDTTQEGKHKSIRVTNTQKKSGPMLLYRQQLQSPCSAGGGKINLRAAYREKEKSQLVVHTYTHYHSNSTSTLHYKQHKKWIVGQLL